MNDLSPYLCCAAAVLAAAIALAGLLASSATPSAPTATPTPAPATAATPRLVAQAAPAQALATVNIPF